MSGYIKLHRSLLDWEWYGDINVTRLFVHLVLRVNHSEKKWQGKLVKEGQLITSISKLSLETGLTTKQVRLALNKLKRTNEVALKSTSQYTMIYVQNYKKYQGVKHQEGIREGKPGANEGQTKGKQRATTKECKEGKNEKNEEKDISKDISKKKVANAPSSPPPNYQDFIDYWNLESVEGIPRVLRLNSIRKNKIKSRLKENKNFFDDFKLVVQKFKKNPGYYTGENGINWKINFDWIIENDLNYIKVLEGNFDKTRNQKMSFRKGKLVESEEQSFEDEIKEALNAICE